MKKRSECSVFSLFSGRGAFRKRKGIDFQHHAADRAGQQERDARGQHDSEIGDRKEIIDQAPGERGVSLHFPGGKHEIPADKVRRIAEQDGDRRPCGKFERYVPAAERLFIRDMETAGDSRDPDRARTRWDSR